MMHIHYDIPGPLGALMNFFVVGIILGYVCIALQFWRAIIHVRAGTWVGLGHQPGGVRAFGYLIGVFVFCSLSGYAPRIIAFPVGLLVVAHGILFACTWAYIIARQTNIIALALVRG